MIYFYRHGRETMKSQHWFRETFPNWTYIGHGKWRDGMGRAIPRLAIRTELIKHFGFKLDEADHLVRSIEMMGVFTRK